MTTARAAEATRRTTPWVWVGLAALVLVILPVLILAANVVWRGTDPVRDEQGLAQVRERLAAARGDLDAVADPVNSHADGGATVTGCSVDSGEVYEPALFREWTFRGPAKGADILETTEPGREVARQVAASMIAKGWSGAGELDGVAATGLSKSFDGYVINLVIQADGESVLATGSTKFQRVCRSSG